MANTPGDSRSRKRVTLFLGGAGGFGQSATGKSSGTHQDLDFCSYHHIAILTYGTVTGGIVSIRGKPVNTPQDSTDFGAAAGAIPIGIDAVNLATEKIYSWIVDGFFNGFEMNITSAITGGGKIAVIINSVQQF